VRGAVVNDPVDSPGRRVRRCGHDLLDEPAERFDPGLVLDAVKQVGVVNVPRGQVRQRPAALVLELVAAPAPRARWLGLVATSERLQLALLIGRDHVLVRPQALAVEHARVQIQCPAGLSRELGVAAVDPALLLPRLDRVPVQPPPDRRRRRVGHGQLDHEPVQLSA
jgi:hypothetical protein